MLVLGQKPVAGVLELYLSERWLLESTVRLRHATVLSSSHLSDKYNSNTPATGFWPNTSISMSLSPERNQENTEAQRCCPTQASLPMQHSLRHNKQSFL